VTTESNAPAMLHEWTIYLRAGEEARRRGDRRIGTEHLVLALLEDNSIALLLGMDLQRAREALDLLDQRALGALGIESGCGAPPLSTRHVPAKPRLRDVAQKGRVRMTPAAKRVLEQASKPNRRRLQVTAQQVLLQLIGLRPPDPAPMLLSALGIDVAEVCRRMNSASPGQ